MHRCCGDENGRVLACIGIDCIAISSLAGKVNFSLQPHVFRN
jgi:hypothetical protein